MLILSVKRLLFIDASYDLRLDQLLLLTTKKGGTVLASPLSSMSAFSTCGAVFPLSLIDSVDLGPGDEIEIRDVVGEVDDTAWGLEGEPPLRDGDYICFACP